MGWAGVLWEPRAQEQDARQPVRPPPALPLGARAARVRRSGNPSAPMAHRASRASKGHGTPPRGRRISTLPQRKALEVSCRGRGGLRLLAEPGSGFAVPTVGLPLEFTERTNE